MKKLILAVIILLGASIAAASVNVTDAPHNATFDIGCSDCHSYSLWWQFSPSTGHSNPSHLDVIVSLCEKCHRVDFDDKRSKPLVKGHHTITAPTAVTCTECHNPHEQEQLYWAGILDDGTSFKSQLYLVTGEIQFGSLISDNATDNATTEFVFSNKVAGDFSYLEDNASIIASWGSNATLFDNWGSNSTLWAKKSGYPKDGLIVAVTDPDDPERIDTFKIKAVEGNEDVTVVVHGIMDSKYDNNATRLTQVGLFYGQLIRKEINGGEVKFFNPFTTYETVDLLASRSGQGGYVYQNLDNPDLAPKGLCVTCHLNTTNWNKDNLCRDENATIFIDCIDDNGTDIDSPDSHYVSQSCANCHTHKLGFAGMPETYKHSEHNIAGIDCYDCHAGKEPILADDKKLKETTVCDKCHNSGVLISYGSGNLSYGLPSISTDEIKTAMELNSPTYVFGCFGCHKGRPDHLDKNDFAVQKALGKCLDNPCEICHTAKAAGVTPCQGSTRSDCATCHEGSDVGDDKCVDYPCKTCHNGNEPPGPSDGCGSAEPGDCLDCHNLGDGICLTKESNDCWDCHVGYFDGNGTATSQADWQLFAVGMESLGHGTLVSTKWIRMYDCWKCHYDTVDENYNLSPKHLNQEFKKKVYKVFPGQLKDLRAEVKMHPDYDIAGLPNSAAFISDNVTSGSGICSNIYCHSDGTSTVELDEVRPYRWKDGGQACNSCHGHDPAKTDCSGCHMDGRDGSYWDRFPEKKWLTAMPMYQNTGVGTENANSHYPHLFTGLSCEYCHAATIKADTVEEVSCLASRCHDPGENTTGNMAEAPHINGKYHVNGTKDVIFKDVNEGEEAKYNQPTKTCSNTVCHIGGEPPVWGGSLSTALVCRQCHGASADEDDFGNFNNKKARISLTQWAKTGHGRLEDVEGVNDDNDDLGDYPSGNPAANFPTNGCWYCHDSKVLHQDEERPFRLIQHQHFNDRFEKECVFCHMLGEDNECLGCHDTDEPSLAPQLVTIGAQTGINPPYTIPRDDHKDYTGGCSNANCHIGDETRHKTGAKNYDNQAEKDDVKNAYLQMGVCLKCHDVEANDHNTGDNKCEACHIAPESDPDRYDLGFDPKLPGTRKIVPQKAKASSFHFGYKHFIDYEDSLDDVIYTDVVNSGDDSTSFRVLVDSKNNHDGNATTSWTEDEFLGRQLKVLFGDDNETRSIVRNSASTITVSPPFTKFVTHGDSYKIIDVVWKGGKFCWDCHDPHGDDNIYMIQNEVATRTDGLVGKPVTRAAVSFTRKVNGSDYARIVPPYNGICNVCHSPEEGVKQHYTSAGGDNHQSGRICTTCHEHRFVDSHAGGDECSKCHTNSRPVPRHTAFGQARNCTKCHAGTIQKRMNIMMQFDEGKSHHVQGANIEVTDRHCYACHWEATPEGIINTAYHEGYNNKNHDSKSGAAVDLVVWGPGKRPLEDEYDDCATDDGMVTVVKFMAKKIDIWSVDSNATLLDQRTEVSKVSKHCLSCHSDQNNDTQPFNMVDELNGDCKTPRQYAWDRSSIGSRYSDSGTTAWGKYTGPNVAGKALQKAFSAHGNAPDNAGGYDIANGEDGAITNTRGGEYAVQCFDCHSSHGSKVTGITSSYSTFDGSHNGANLKETQKGKGGYAMAYMATANKDEDSLNPYQAGAGQCFDCHDSASSNTYLTATAKTPWGYNDIFGADAPIRGYRDSEKFGGDNASQADRGLTDRYDYKHSTLMGGHLKASHRNPNSGVVYDDNGTIWYDDTNTTIEKYPINGLCSPCHDPHGISRSLGDDRQYAVPLLKGTWMSSPYKEDVAPEKDGPYASTGKYQNYRKYWQASYLPPQQRADGRNDGAWRTDRNTFNQANLALKSSHPVQYNTVAEDAEQFAGLCLRCHPKSSLTTDIDPGDNTTLTDNLDFRSKDRIHRSVKGWGWGAGEEPREHSFTCSKCHSVHVSGLPRLMKTNCLNYKHRSKQVSGGTVGTGTSNMGKFPFGWWAMSEYQPNSTAICHGADSANGSSGWPDNQKWNEVTPWGGQ